MALYDRLTGRERPKLSPHIFAAALSEFVRGKMTGAQVVAALGLSPAEVNELQTLQSRLSAGLTAIEIHEVVLLAEQRIAPYETAAKLANRLTTP